MLVLRDCSLTVPNKAQAALTLACRQGDQSIRGSKVSLGRTLQNSRHVVSGQPCTTCQVTLQERSWYEKAFQSLYDKFYSKTGLWQAPQFRFAASKTAEKVTEALHDRTVRSRHKQVPADDCLKSACQPDAPHEGSLGRTTAAGELAPETTAASCMPGSAAAIAVGDDMLL